MKKTKKHFDLMIVICSLSELAIGLAVIFFGNLLIRNNEYFSSLNYASAKNDGVYSMYILSFMLIFAVMTAAAIVVNVMQFKKNKQLYDERKQLTRRNINMLISIIPFVLIGCFLFVEAYLIL